jgi:hypothetical protein
VVHSRTFWRRAQRAHIGGMSLTPWPLPEGRRILLPVHLSREARQRVRAMDFYLVHGCDARVTCRHVGISLATFYRWRQRYDPRRLESLEDDRLTRRHGACARPRPIAR